MKSWKKTHPPDDGWMRTDLTMRTATPLGVEQIKRIATFGAPESYEYGPIEQYGKRVSIVMRKHEANSTHS